jgi:hypothetical protein
MGCCWPLFPLPVDVLRFPEFLARPGAESRLSLWFRRWTLASTPALGLDGRPAFNLIFRPTFQLKEIPMKPSHVEFPKSVEPRPAQKKTRFQIVKLEERIAPTSRGFSGTDHRYNTHRGCIG